MKCVHYVLHREKFTPSAQKTYGSKALAQQSRSKNRSSKGLIVCVEYLSVTINRVCVRTLHTFINV